MRQEQLGFPPVIALDTGGKDVASTLQKNYEDMSRDELVAECEQFRRKHARSERQAWTLFVFLIIAVAGGLVIKALTC